MVMQPVLEISAADDFEPEAEHGPCPTDPLGTFLHGLLSIDQVRKLVARAQQDVRDFLSLAGTWAEQHLPAQAAAVTAALARALDLAPAR
ncbi:hypothetical protein [Streptomyces sp. NBC_00304]|uniref:hypothetical protein n=1 Tax=Streptomyces sp. NBC_00304 TaxID=2975706 RepID=UPI002E2DE68F|nr:hypothetical protein [Streptomyces sp. NBC_00304]